MSDHGESSRCRAWLRRKLGRVHSSTTKHNEQTGITLSGQQNWANMTPNDCLPPPYDNRQTIPNRQTTPSYSARPPIIALARGDVAEIRNFVNEITSKLDKRLAPKLTDTGIRSTVVAIIHEGCIGIATTVRQVALQTSLNAVNDLVNDGRRKAAEAVTAVARALHIKWWISLSTFAAEELTKSANKFVKDRHGFLIQRAASAELIHVVHGVAAVISFRFMNNCMRLDQVDLLPREQFEHLHPNGVLSSYVAVNSFGLSVAGARDRSNQSVGQGRETTEEEAAWEEVRNIHLDLES